MLDQIDRRRFLLTPVISALSAAFTACSSPKPPEPVSRQYRVGYVSPTAGIDAAWGLRTLRDTLGALGYNEGVNLRIEARYGHGRYENLPARVTELLQEKVDVIVAMSASSAIAALHATTTTPIVFSAVSEDPVRLGLVASIERPGGNVTGAMDATSEFHAMRLRALKDLVPRLSRIGVLRNPGNVAATAALAELETVAWAVGVRLYAGDVGAPAELVPVIRDLIAAKVDALMVASDPILAEHGSAVVGAARQRRLPLLGWRADWAEAGALLTYGVDGKSMQAEAGALVAAILGGAKPGELPVVQPSRFELVLNTRTANALGIVFPSSWLARADRIIE